MLPAISPAIHRSRRLTADRKSYAFYVESRLPDLQREKRSSRDFTPLISSPPGRYEDFRNNDTDVPFRKLGFAGNRSTIS